MNPTASQTQPISSRWLTWLQHQWFLVSLMIALAIGLAFHQLLAFIVDLKWLQSGIVFTVMFLMALPIPWLAIKVAIAKPWPAVLGSMINLIAIPLMAIAFAKLLPTELASGLIVASLVPSTIASAAVWTRRAGGDDTIAVLITLITNFSCVLITPMWLTWLLGTQVNLSSGPLIASLAMLVLAPILLAQVLRRFRAVEKFGAESKATLSTLCQVGILSMVLIGAIQMGDKLFERESIGWPFMVQILVTCGIVILIHGIAMAMGWYAALYTGVDSQSRIAVAFGGSQKTLMVGLKLAIDVQASILPMVAYHVLQLVVDAAIASRWRRQERQERQEPLSSPEQKKP